VSLAEDFSEDREKQGHNIERNDEWNEDPRMEVMVEK
jgi:hypothetical protein